jgi:type I restriction enzyme R subunit
MASGVKEKDFEGHIVEHLSAPSKGGYIHLLSEQYDKSLCMVPEEVLNFIQDTQPKAYKALHDQYGAQTDQRILQNLKTNIKNYGTLHVLRKGFRDRGQDIKLCYFKPANSKNAEHQELYEKNRFAVIRQLYFSDRSEESIDVVLFLNGLPIITAEVKNALTGQYLTDAIRQYKQDRDPREPLLAYKRCLVHFAVSTEKVSMTTKLAKEATFFLPFNMGIENPVNETGFAISYLWEDVWSKDSLLDLIQNFLHIQKEKEKFYDEATKTLREKETEKFIFPRFHQRRAVYKLLEELERDGVGTNYLIQHSAGSGKSNTISWLAHRLSGFFRNADDQNRMYDSVIVVTDRRVLDKQLRDNIRQFEQVPGVVEAIDDKKSAQDLKHAIEKGKSIIITTLQKFPVISETIRQLPNRNYAVIIDEAHSSQTGEAGRKMRKALSLKEAEVEEEREKTLDELVLEEIEKTGRQKNISFFAFTATPKNKTKELFGTMINGELQAIEKYTMEQAIKEGFILDVLKSYVSFKRYYKLAKRPDIDDKEYDKRKTIRLLNSYVDLQDDAIETKSRIMLEHFVTKTAKEIQGKARAMLVTRSRLHAVRYKRKFDDIMREMNLPYKALVAFSGSVYDAETDQEYTETSMNELQGKYSIVEAFKLPQYRILIVANKFQTGFDEPLLHTMFVDKKLGDVNTVQTLSRLNRTAFGKNSTMILDFVNDPEKVQEDFQDYYTYNFMKEENQTDPNELYDILTSLTSFPVFNKQDVEAYADIWFRKGDNMERLQPILNCCKLLFDELNDDEKEKFRKNTNDFTRLYRFLSLIITFKDVDLEKHYIFLSHLIRKLPKNGFSLPTEVLDEVELATYKVQKQFETEMSMVSEPGELYGMHRSGEGKPPEDEQDLLSNIIKALNDTYGLNLKEEDKKDFTVMRDKINADAELASYFNPANSKENIRDKFNEKLDEALLDFINTKLDLYNKLSEDKANATMKRMWFNAMYDHLVRDMRRI